MQAREKKLLIGLGVVAVIGIVVFVLLSSPWGGGTATTSSDQMAAPSEAEKVLAAIDNFGKVLESDKYLMLTTYGQIPVTFSEDEIGKSPLYSISDAETYEVQEIEEE